jgi:hypothetical protein|tara:strand:+ start:174 stop:326 length:153 start_codon:yes stop_codon:yes gene_type:complete
MNLTDLKIYGMNIGALMLSLTEIEAILKVAVLAATLGYTLHKWYYLKKQK